MRIITITQNVQKVNFVRRDAINRVSTTYNKNMDRVAGIRGAITVKENTASCIVSATKVLISEIFFQNKIDKSKVINIIFTVTDDLDLVNPATAAREEFKLDLVPMLCVQEIKLKNGLQKCIRVLVQIHSDVPLSDVKHVYLEGATNLRPDLSYEI